MKTELIPTTNRPLDLEMIESLEGLAAIDNPVADLPLFQDPAPPAGRHFRGTGVKTVRDERRLGGIYRKVFEVMKDQHWRTAEEIHASILAAFQVGCRDETIGRMLRYIGDPLVGGHHKETRARDASKGLYEHRIIPKGTDAFRNWMKDQGKP